MSAYDSLTHALPDFINMHDARKALAELEDMEQDAIDNPEDSEGLDEEEQDQLDSLRALKDAVYDWDSLTQYGGTLISEGNFKDYAEETAYDIGMVERDSDISSYIDWDKWADALQQDYTEADVESGEFEGTWYYRV